MPDVPPHATSTFRPARWIALTLCVAVGAAAFAVYRGALVVPERFNPWAPLDVMAVPDLLTDFKLSRALAEPALCQAALARTGMQYDRLPDRVTGPSCGFENAVRLRSAAVRFGAPLSLSCPMALSFFMWERNALQPVAQARFGQRVTSVEHLGSYACRNINRGEGVAPGASRSRHAAADALDIAGLTLADGRRISVLRDWESESEWPAAATRVTATAKPVEPAPQTDAAAALLQDIHQGACRYFRGVLGPDYNAAHRDHFHLETGGYRMCR